MREMSHENNKDGIRLKFVDEKHNVKNKWWIAIGETPFFWLVVMRDCEGGMGSNVFAVKKTDMVPVEEVKEAKGATKEAKTAKPAKQPEPVDDASEFM